jgi:hypothetical protein
LGVILRDPPHDKAKWLMPAWSSIRDVLRKITDSLQAAQDAVNGLPGAHMLMGESHEDTVRRVPVRGDIIAARLVGVDGAKWSGVPIGGDELLLYSNGTDPNWSQATTGSYTDASVVYSKIQDVTAASRLLGRGSAAGSGDVQEITLGAGLTMTGTVLDSAATPANVEATARLWAWTF